MNGKLSKKHKPRRCSIPEEYIVGLAEELTKGFLDYRELLNYIKERTHKRYELDNILGVLEARGFLITEEKRRTSYGFKTYYTIMTKDKYDKIEEEHRENAKRRLLAAVSY